MQRAIVVRGKLADSWHIELDEPVTEVEGAVEVVLRAVPAESALRDVFAFIASRSPGSRTKEDIDRQLTDERGAWTER